MNTWFLVLRVTVTLVAVLVALWWLHRKVSARVGGSGRGRDLTVVQRQALGKSTAVAVVAVDGRRLLLGVSEHGINLLSELEPTPVDDAGNGDDERRDESEGDSDDDGPVHGDRAADFAAQLRKAQAANAPRTALSGSLLSADTWRQAWAGVSGGAR